MALILPAVRAMQAQGIGITWLIGPDAYRLVSGIPDIHWFVQRGGLSAGRKIARQLPAETRFCLLEPPGLEASLAISGTPRSSVAMGYATLWNGTPHAIKRYWHAITGRAPQPADCAHWGIPFERAAREPLLLISPCASTPERDWSTEGYAALAAHARSLGLEPLVVHAGTMRERRLLEHMRQYLAVRDQACDLQGLLRLLSAAACLVSPDSGPGHLAGITGTPVIGLYGPASLMRWGPYWSQPWSLEAQPDEPILIGQVLARLTALAAAGYPRCGGEGASMLETPIPSTSEKKNP